MASWMGTSGEYRAYDEEIGSFPSRDFRAVHAMNRSTQKQQVSSDSTHVANLDPFLTQLNAIGAAQHCYINSVIHDKQGFACRDLPQAERPVQQVASRQVPLSELDHVDSAVDCRFHNHIQRPTGSLVTVRDETERRIRERKCQPLIPGGGRHASRGATGNC